VIFTKQNVVQLNLIFCLQLLPELFPPLLWAQLTLHGPCSYVEKKHTD